MRLPIALALLLVTATSCHSPLSNDSPPSATTSQDERMAWWRDARFGMFLHWGLYAIPAGEWQGNKDHGEWIRTTAQIPRDTYAKFQPQWNPVDFDADQWARLAKDAGMKYVVITSKHHDGFCLFDSEHTDWDVGNTPHGRDIMAELSAACRKHGLKFCTYHSIMDWHHPDYLPRRGWEKDRSTDGADFDRFERYLHAQVTEIIERYRPAVMWFDGEWENTWTHERGVRLFELCRRLAPEMIVNNRVDVHRQGMAGFSKSDEAVGDFDTPEQEIPATGLPGVDWESCMTMNRHWGWNAADTQWKSTETIVQNLVDIASKGGNYLLNVGPRADGTFPPEALSVLTGLRLWMGDHKEAIYGTTASVFDDLPWGRCTVKAGDVISRLYLHVFDYPRGDRELLVPGLGNKVKAAYLLRQPERPLDVRVDPAGRGVLVRVPIRAPNAMSVAIVLEIEGRPIVYRTPTIAADVAQFVSSMTVSVQSPTRDAELRYTLDGTEPTASSPRATAPFPIDQSCTVRAAMFHDGERKSDIAQRTFEKATPLPPVKALPRGDGLLLQGAAVDWQSIPEDRSLFGSKAAAVTDIALPRGTGEAIALQFAGFVDVPTTELHRFALTSDDGSKLWIDGRLVVDNDGLHGTVEKRGAIAIAKGMHRIELVWFNRTGGAELGLKWALPGQPFAPLPAAALKH